MTVREVALAVRASLSLAVGHLFGDNGVVSVWYSPQHWHRNQRTIMTGPPAGRAPARRAARHGRPRELRRFV